MPSARVLGGGAPIKAKPEPYGTGFQTGGGPVQKRGWFPRPIWIRHALRMSKVKAGYAQANASLSQADESLRKTTVFSPMDGTVSQLNSELGERVLGTVQFQGTDVMTIADLSRMEARVEVSENDVVLVSIGDTARISVDAFPDRKANAVVYEIANTATSKGLGTQEEVTNFQVKMRVVEASLTLRPGMSMTGDIETETKHDILCVPIQSLTTRLPKIEMKQGPPERTGTGGRLHFGKKERGEQGPGDRLCRGEWCCQKRACAPRHQR